jgi:hypothetical protein
VGLEDRDLNMMDAALVAADGAAALLLVRLARACSPASLAMTVSSLTALSTSSAFSTTRARWMESSWATSPAVGDCSR